MTMTKRERDAIGRKLNRLTARVAKKRDEIREIVSNIEELLESVSGAADEMDWTISHLENALRSLDNAADQASQYA